MSQAEINRAAFRLLTNPEFAPLIQSWELELSNARTPPGPIDPYRLAMSQGDRERLLSIKLKADAHRQSLQKDRDNAG